MGVEKLDFYAACDRAIQTMNRDCVKTFGQLKLAKFDRLNVIRIVTDLYRKSAKKAEQQYYEESFEVYVLILMALGTDSKKAHRMAEKAVSREWVKEKLKQPDPVTLYRFDNETERKAQRLAEALGGTQNRDQEIDKALRLWSRQLGQYAINFTDHAVLQAYKDAGVKKVVWITQFDERVCEECSALHGMEFELDKVPAKPHMGCRCYFIPSGK